MVEELTADLQGAICLASLFILLVFLTEAWTRIFNPSAELSRKAVHIGGGFLCLFFPFYIQSPFTVLVLAVAMSALFFLGCRFRFLLCLCRVERQSRGGEYYPLTIFFVFLFSWGVIWIYIASILVLACADAGAALIGSRYGTIRYTVDQETKSLQGSLVFLFLAFLGVFLPLNTMSTLPVDAAILTALLVATVVTMVEAVSRNGRDNLFVPIAVCLILPKITSKPIDEILYQNISLLGMLGLLSLAAWRSKSMNVGGCLTTILFFYACWSLGSELWTIPLLGAFVLFVMSWRVAMQHGAEKHIVRVPIVAQALTPPLMILLLANFSGRYNILFAPFVAAVMQISNSFILAHFSDLRANNLKGRRNVLTSVVATWVFVALPSWYFQLSNDTALLFCLLILTLPFAFLGDHSTAGDMTLYDQNKYRTIKTFSIALLVYGLEHFGIPNWIHWQHQ